MCECELETFSDNEESEFGVCECGEHLFEHREYPTGEKQFLPAVYLLCPRCDR